MYATGAALRLPAINSTETSVEYTIAAHPPILHFRGDTGCVVRLSDEQLPIGLLSEACYRSHIVQVQPNDLLLIATDGVLDAENSQGEAFGLERLEAFLLEFEGAPLADIANQLHNTLRDSYNQSDDQSLLAIRFR
jgi:sigma-B regulation protein RsbU (phosphoserine phosphatase)